MFNPRLALGSILASLVISPLLACGDAREPVDPTSSGAGAADGDRSTPVESSRGSEARYVAVLRPAARVDVPCKEAGDLLAVHVRPGDRVQADQVIAELDSRPIDESLAIARAELRSLKSVQEQRDIEIAAARSTLARATQMHKEGIGPRKDVDDARYALDRAGKIKDGAAAAVAKQQALIAQLQRRRRDAKIKAPFAGSVSLRYRDPGTAVAAGTPIVRLIKVDGLQVRFAVPPTDIARIRVGDQVQVEIEAVAESLLATVREVYPELDTASQTIFVDAWLEVPEGLRNSSLAGRRAWVQPTERVTRGSTGGASEVRADGSE